jgi:hypothetical protein
MLFDQLLCQNLCSLKLSNLGYGYSLQNGIGPLFKMTSSLSKVNYFSIRSYFIKKSEYVYARNLEFVIVLCNVSGYKQTNSVLAELCLLRSDDERLSSNRWTTDFFSILIGRLSITIIHHQEQRDRKEGKWVKLCLWVLNLIKPIEE